MKIIAGALIIVRCVQIKMTILRCEYSFFPKLVGIFLGEVVQHMFERSARGCRHIFFTIFRPKKFPKKKKMSSFEELSVGLVF